MVVFGKKNISYSQGELKTVLIYNADCMVDVSHEAAHHFLHMRCT